MIASHRMSLLVLILVLLLSACAGGDERDNAGQGAPGSDTGAAMGSMRGMQEMPSGRMMEQMRTHMSMMEGVTADSMRVMMAVHRQMVANMISQMNREMRDMNMTGDAAWTATMDSVRQDLVDLPEMGTAELRRLFPAHRTRVMRLVDAHREMMRNMTR